MTELTAAAPRFHWDAWRVGAGVGAALGLALVAFASGGYFPTAWTWTALVALVFVAAVLGLGVALRPSGLGLLSLGGLAGFGVWTWLAIVWSEDPAATVLEGLRVLMYVSVFTAILLVLRREGVPLLLAATLAAIVLASGYGLLTRLFPERLGSFDPVAAYRLEEPLTYWNAAGLFAAMGALLALGFAARAQTVAARALASATQPVFLATLYFTFSRGAWIAGAVGLAVALAIDPRRLQLLLTGLVLAIPSGLAVLLSSHQETLTRTDVSDPSAASHQGHRLAVYILLLALAAGLAGAGLWLAERRVTPPRQARLAFAGAAALVLVVGVLGAFVHYGGPVELVRKGYDSFTTTSGDTPVDLNQRLFSFSGSYRAELWHAAWHDYQAHPVLGSGPGTYEWYWDEHRPLQHKVRDAHNLYLEVLAETGPVGLLLLILALGTPLVAAFRARGHPLVPVALAAFAAFLVHATVDWDWEMSAVTLAALACAAALLTAATSRSTPILSPRLRAAGVGASLLLAVLAFVGVVGSSALAASDRALTKGDYAKAASQARKASKWWRWSPDPWRELGDIAVARNDSQAARIYYRKAIAKDDTDWKLWYDLSTVSNGAESNRALAKAVRLNRYARSDFEAGDVPG
jgi:O-antigen ligase/polysaccharide polymerase Wzy-like membrane protein